MTAPPGGVQATTLVDDVRLLLDESLDAYRDDPDALPVLRAQRERLDEPLRIALVGRVKAGKSTLLNALVGERLAPTDAGECTRVVTWYRHGAVPRVALHPVDGLRRVLPVRRVDGALRLDLAGTPPEDVERLVVDWPTAGLAAATLLDTPGISSLDVGTSARAWELLDRDELPVADAVVFLTRQMQPEDLDFLARFQEATGGPGVHTTTITVLSRADELGAGRVDALLAAQQVARRMSGDPAVRARSQAVVPVAGLVGLAGRMLRHREFVALRSLAAAERADLEAMLLSADRFCRDDAPVPVSRELRVTLLERLGIFGIRLAVALIRTGVSDAGELGDQLVRRSGLAELQRLLTVHFLRRSAALRAATAVRLVERLLRERPVADAVPLWARVERLQIGTQELVELELLARSRAVDGPIPPEFRAEAERLLGAEGPDPADRLGLAADAPPEELRAAALTALDRWRARALDPLAGRPTVDACADLARSCEAVVATLDAAGSGAPAAQPAP
ncbi:dynamin family protein [Blastococcus capsensis]|uniref:dynamin family protein n=1 Tax=Blastococcus capsensis TaxID=1564163 RepID=UPI00253FBA80|nr:dynamin family protein [Blastococcus capsensis]MDK3255092.1 dynamin family protein [Blastococcus capsensis]